jgi:hypothetical protein
MNTNSSQWGKHTGVMTEKKGRFRSVERQSSKLSKDLVTLYHSPGLDTDKIPLLMGSFSFFDELKESLWEDFRPADWYVPEFVLYASGTKCIGSFQIVPGSESDAADRLETISELYIPQSVVCSG